MFAAAAMLLATVRCACASASPRSLPACCQARVHHSSAPHRSGEPTPCCPHCTGVVPVVEVAKAPLGNLSLSPPFVFELPALTLDLFPTDADHRSAIATLPVLDRLRPTLLSLGCCLNT